MSKLHVYTCNLDGTRERMVAATSQKKAAELMGMTLGHFRSYGCITMNDYNMSVALSYPGVVWDKMYRNNSLWERV